jgi:hypothetical protein
LSYKSPVAPFPLKIISGRYWIARFYVQKDNAIFGVECMWKELGNEFMYFV